jgi:hypothetical protein
LSFNNKFVLPLLLLLLLLVNLTLFDLFVSHSMSGEEEENAAELKIGDGNTLPLSLDISFTCDLADFFDDGFCFLFRFFESQVLNEL